jgi:hypothetical protein
MSVISSRSKNGESAFTRFSASRSRLLAAKQIAPSKEASMSITVVLGVGLDSWLLASRDAMWRSAGFVVEPAGSIREAIDHFQAGDFDLVLLGHSISSESKERLTFLIRASGSQTPVISIASLAGDGDWFADGPFDGNSSELPTGMAELLAEKEKNERQPKHLQGVTTESLG